MAHRYQLSLFIFRRDLRLFDNTALIAALQNSAKVIPIFILDPRQLENNPYRSDRCVQFMLESLLDLQQQLAAKKAQLYVLSGQAENKIEQLLNKYPIEAVYFNRDYTSFSVKRDAAIAHICEQRAINSHAFDDNLLTTPSFFLKKDGTPYRIFTPFYEHAKQFLIPLPRANHYRNYYTKSISIADTGQKLKRILSKFNAQLIIQGGRTAALKKLKHLKVLTDYAKERDYPAAEATSGLSPYHKFNNCSIRESYYAIKKNIKNSEAMLRELYWRDFFTLIGYYFPNIFEGAFQSKYNQIAWENNLAKFKAWCEGKTGFPIVDAGMRELNQTGLMHNRLRLITASFLVKDLHIDWHWGEQYFAQQLIDYDPAVNNGNWQWIASTGTDAQPYFRIFNPWLQQRKFDPQCQYIKKWLPELQNLDHKLIHQWYKIADPFKTSHYPKPIIDHKTEVAKTKKIYLKHTS